MLTFFYLFNAQNLTVHSIVAFRPLNFEWLSREERDYWEGPFLFTFAPTSLNLNAPTNYIKEHYIFGSRWFEGVAFKKVQGVCNDIIFYSDDLPIPLEIKG